MRVFPFAHSWAWLGVSICVAGLLASPALGQSRLEESKPPRLQGKQLSSLSGGQLKPEDASTEALGVDVRGIRLVSAPGQIVQNSTAAGVVTDELDAPAGINLDAALQPFIGKSLSFKLLADIRTKIVQTYRASGRAFVAVVVPPQEISGGSIQLIVTESRLAQKSVEGTKFTPDTYILDAVRAKEGEAINSDDLIDDLNWLNLNPYRNISVIAEPGRQFGQTNLILRANEQKPWAIYGGYNNHGTPSTDRNRIYAGFHTASFPVLDHHLSYQLTASPGALTRFGRNFTSRNQAAYLSNDAYYFAPLPWRHKLRLRAAYIKSRSSLVGGLVSSSTTRIFSAEYAVPVTFSTALRPDIYARYEFKAVDRNINNPLALVSSTGIDVHQLMLGLRGNQSDQLGKTNFDLRAVFSPGNLSARNSNANFAAFGANPAASARYFYLYGNLQRATPLGMDFSLLNELQGQWSSRGLPSTEGFAAGGNASVRGYNTAEVGGDFGIVSRNELHRDLTSSVSGIEGFPITQLDVFAFADFGHVRDLAAGTSQNLGGAGFGLNANFGTSFTVSANVGMALLSTPSTRRGTVRANLNINSRF